MSIIWKPIFWKSSHFQHKGITQNLKDKGRQYPRRGRRVWELEQQVDQDREQAEWEATGHREVSKTR